MTIQHGAVAKPDIEALLTSFAEWQFIVGTYRDRSDPAVNEARLKRDATHAALLSAIRSLIVVPDGWKLVPVEPTQEMCTAFWQAWNGEQTTAMGDVYRAILDAAPQFQQQAVAKPDYAALDALAFLITGVEQYLGAPTGPWSEAMARLSTIKDRAKKAHAEQLAQVQHGDVLRLGSLLQAIDYAKHHGWPQESITKIEAIAAMFQQRDVAKAIHYPECWDTAAYPELGDALVEIGPALRAFRCTNADCAHIQQQALKPVAFADRIAFESAMAAGKGCDVWPVAGDYEQRTGRKLIALYAEPFQHGDSAITRNDTNHQDVKR